MNRREKALIIIGIIFISFNLRAPITAVGSLADMIQSQYSLSGGALGLITTLLLIAFALVSPFVSRYSLNGYGNSMAIGLLFIIVGEIICSYTNSIGLFIGTASFGMGIAIGNILISRIIKAKYPNKLGPMTSVYISGLCLFAAVGAGLSILLAKGLDLGWQNYLVSWSILALITFIIWIPQLKKQQKSSQPTSEIVSNISNGNNRSIWRSATAWWVTLSGYLPFVDILQKKTLLHSL